jgi:pimeloyl-ACP methyl ester carboxylesterase
VWRRNIPALSEVYRVIAPDLRGHGDSDKSIAGYHVSRLAMDLKNIIDGLQLAKGNIRVVGGSLGCAILWFVSISLKLRCAPFSLT